MNASSAGSYGIELECDALRFDNRVLNGSIGWLEARYDQQFVMPDRTRPDYAAPIAGHFPDVDLEDNLLPRSPRFIVSAGAQYTLALDEQVTLKSRVDFYYRDDVSFRQYGNSADVQRSYTRTDLRLT